MIMAMFLVLLLLLLFMMMMILFIFIIIHYYYDHGLQDRMLDRNTIESSNNRGSVAATPQHLLQVYGKQSSDTLDIIYMTHTAIHEFHLYRPYHSGAADTFIAICVTYMCVCACTYIYINICIHIYIYMYICICICAHVDRHITTK